MTYNVFSGTLNPTHSLTLLHLATSVNEVMFSPRFVGLSMSQQDYSKSRRWILVKFLKDVRLEIKRSIRVWRRSGIGQILRNFVLVVRETFAIVLILARCPHCKCNDEPDINMAYPLLDF